MNRLKEKLKDLLKKFNDDDFFPYPYIFKPPSPPGDDVLQGQLKPEFIPPKKKQEFEPYCKHCGAELPAVQLICPACGKKI
ncbi:MAG: zinc-ribbon domain-containing protein [Candidatus Hodarchaeota archaeon]